jgi:hypothetical protein
MELDNKARGVLSSAEYEIFKDYYGRGGHPISASTATAFFELYVNGYDVHEIHRLNPAFPLGSLYWAKVQYGWDIEKERILADLMGNIKEKVMKAQLETTGLMADILLATNKRYRDQVKKYLQTGDDSSFGRDLNISSIQSLLKLSEGLLKLTGQANTQTIKSDKNININVQSNPDSGVPILDADLTSDEAAAILEALANAKRRKES